MNECAFCDLSETKIEFDKPFYSGNGYKAISSIGAITEGWVLVVPDMHCTSSKNFFEKDSYINFVNEIRRSIQGEYGECVVFEHGPKEEGSLTGCGVDHAHLHIVPLSYREFQKSIDQSGRDWTKVKFEEINSHVGDAEYLLYSGAQEWEERSVRIHILEESESQFFRKVAAMVLGVPDNYDYKKYQYIENAIKTRRRLVGKQVSPCEVA